MEQQVVLTAQQPFTFFTGMINATHVSFQVKEPVVANNATASTVAFIAPGPPNPPITQVSMKLYI